MKKSLIVILCVLSSYHADSQNIVNSSFFSEALQQTIMADVFLPPGYDDNPDLFYPVIYYFHPWGGNQNSGNTYMNTAFELINSGTIDPVIMVCADNSPGPFGGSMYVNSTLWGNYEDMMVNDLPNWIENTYRAMPDRNYRGLFGQSMGGYGVFRYGILYKEQYKAFASHAGLINLQEGSAVLQTQELLHQENSGPPYFYDFYDTGLITQGQFLMAGAFAPRPDTTPQTYVTPPIVEFGWDEMGNPIDTVALKVIPYDIAHMIHQLSPADSLGIYFGVGSQDEWFLYPGTLDVKDTLDLYGIPYVFYEHNGGHAMPMQFRLNALEFLDSLLSPPAPYPTNCLPEGILFSDQTAIDSFQINYPYCTEIEGNVSIYGGDINNLDGLDVLGKIGGGLIIYDCDALSNLSGLQNIDSTGFLKIQHNDGLYDLSDLDNLTYAGSQIRIQQNWNLTSLTGLENTSTTGSVMISMNPSLVDLIPLGNIDSLGSFLEISGNTLLTDLQGLHNITTIGGDLIINENDSLQDLSELSNLTSVPGNLSLSGESLSSLEGLNNISYVGGGVDIYNTALQNLDGLDLLDSIGGWLAIGIWTEQGNPADIGNPYLENLSALNNLTSIGGDLINGSLIILSNDSLTSLAGLENIAEYSIFNLDIAGNQSLSTCEINMICDYLTNPTGDVTIEGNASGCNSQEEVEEACEAVDIYEQTQANEISIYPNPAKTIIIITPPDDFTIKEICFYNQLGQKVLKKTKGTNMVDISMLDRGLYFVEILTDRFKIREKLLIE
jgi:S-formylglutathione hydrolase FrmB